MKAPTAAPKGGEQAELGLWSNSTAFLQFTYIVELRRAHAQTG